MDSAEAWKAAKKISQALLVDLSLNIGHWIEGIEFHTGVSGGESPVGSTHPTPTWLLTCLSRHQDQSQQHRGHTEKCGREIELDAADLQRFDLPTEPAGQTNCQRGEEAVGHEPLDELSQ